ncbi:MAG TPA: hypothetical protein VKD43_02115, partial [Xanthobacteraceae bacterium]|nr:hypothetical protein [Xanthobacteraceae bacterium]
LLLLAGLLLRILALLAALIRHGVLLLSLSLSRTADTVARFPPRFRQYRNQIAEGLAKTTELTKLSFSVRRRFTWGSASERIFIFA